MKTKLNLYPIKLTLLSMLTGVIVGVSIMLYTQLIHLAEIHMKSLSAFLQGNLWFVPICLLLFIGVAFLIKYISSFEVSTRGGGVVQAEGMMIGGLTMRYYIAIPIVVICSFLAIMCGISLGGEGPSILIGALFASMVAKIFKVRPHTEQYLITGGAGAGIATAFNVPLTGIIFSLEEGQKKFSTLMLLSTVATVGSAITVLHIFKSDLPLFPIVNIPKVQTYLCYTFLVLFGIIIAFVGKAYTKLFQAFKKFYKKHKWLANDYSMVLPFVVAIPVLMFLPAAAGPGGANILDSINGKYGLYALLVLFLVKFLFTILASSSGLVGGIFIPLLSIGALIGALIGGVFNLVIPEKIPMAIFVLSSIAVMMTIVTGSPITAIVLSVELTGTFSSFLPILCAVGGSLIVASATHHKPLYSTLLWNMRKHSVKAAKRFKFEITVEEGSYLDEIEVRDILFRSNVLISKIVRNGNDIVPECETEILVGDILVINAETLDEVACKNELIAMATK